MKALLTTLVLVALLAVGLFFGGLGIAYVGIPYALPTYGVLALAAILGWFRYCRRPVPRQLLPCLLATGAFFGYVLLRTICSPVEYIARTDLLMVLGALMLYLLVTLHLTSPRHRMAIAVCLLLLGVAHTVVGAIQFSKGNEYMVFDFQARGQYGVRASGFYRCPNHLAGFLEVVALMGLSIACWSRWRLWIRLVIGYLAVFCLAGLVITGSRGGYLSTVFGVLVLVLLSILVLRKQNRSLFWRVVGTNLLLAGILAFSAERMIAKNYFVQTRSANVLTEGFRPMLWKSGLEQFKLNPIWGTGSQTFRFYGRQFRAQGLTNDPVYLHNDYLQFLAEFGIAGMLGFLLFFAAHLRSGGQTFATVVAKRTTVSLIGSNSVALNIGALASAAAYSLHSFVDFNLHIPANTLLLAFVFGVLTGSSTDGVAQRSGPSNCSPLLSRLLRLSLPAVAIWMAIIGISNLRAEYCAERAIMALKNWQYAECDWYADQGLALTSRNPYLFYYKGEAQAGLAEATTEPQAKDRLTEQSVGNFRKAIELFPQEENFVLSLGWALDGLKRFDESEPLFLRALELDPNSVQVQFYYAAHLHLCGRRIEAEALYRKAQAGGSASAAYGLQRLMEEDKAGADKEVASGKARQ